MSLHNNQHFKNAAQKAIKNSLTYQQTQKDIIKDIIKDIQSFQNGTCCHKAIYSYVNELIPEIEKLQSQNKLLVDLVNELIENLKEGIE